MCVPCVPPLLRAVGFAVEVASDSQKTAFREDTRNEGRFITSGLWAVSRHPNYVGEITLWIGVLLLSSTGFTQPWDWLCLLYVPALVPPSQRVCTVFLPLPPLAPLFYCFTTHAKSA